MAYQRTLTSLAGCSGFALLMLAGLGMAASAAAGVVEFAQSTDTIRIDGQTVLGTSGTFEARVRFPGATGAGGNIFNEWTDFAEDKALSAGPGSPGHVIGFSFPSAGEVIANEAVSFDVFHHLAYVQDGTAGERRLYLDGSLVGTLPGASDIGDGTGQGFLGAIFRGANFRPGFIGLLDTFRISESARYAGAGFAAPGGELSADADTLLLYNFLADEIFLEDGLTRITDVSGNGRTGTFGVGFNGATAPALVVPSEPTPSIPEPGTLVLLGAGLGALAWSRRRRRSPA